MNAPPPDDLLSLLAAGVAEKKISAPAAANIRRWLTEPQFNEFAGELANHLTRGMWPELEEAFWTVLPFGTAGRRGPMYPIGAAAINDRTVGESAQGLADYARGLPGGGEPLRFAVAYDTRHRSRHFAKLCCEVMAAAGFTVHFLDGHRSTPELSFAIRHLACHCGIMVSASHNPPRDNAVKVFGSNGGQLRPPADAELMRCVEAVTAVRRRPFDAALAGRQIVCCQEDIDARYRTAVLAHAFAGPRDIRILYSPLHGVGLTSVLPVLRGDGFSQVEVFAPHAEPDGDFPNVPGGIANPENPEVFSQLVARAAEIDADLVLASDPDADRLGCAARLTSDGEWQVLNGNQIAALLADYILRRRRAAGKLTSQHYVVKTLVTTDMVRRLADLHGVKTFGDVLTGFKWISGVVDREGPERFVFGCEEAHGYMIGDYVRDKDAAGAAMLLAELCAETKSKGRTLHQELERLYLAVGYHEERSFSLVLPGAEGQARMRQIMDRLRREPPAMLGGAAVAEVRDYGSGRAKDRAGSERLLPDPRSDLLFFDSEPPGSYAAARPSGTEPKLKFYLFGYCPPVSPEALPQSQAAIGRRLDGMEADLLQLAGG